jgi:antitoxin component HigA of HigAB toxin-antitoxin module
MKTQNQITKINYDYSKAGKTLTINLEIDIVEDVLDLKYSKLLDRFEIDDIEDFKANDPSYVEIINKYLEVYGRDELIEDIKTELCEYGYASHICNREIRFL